MRVWIGKKILAKKRIVMTNEQRLRMLYRIKGVLLFDKNRFAALHLCPNITICAESFFEAEEFTRWFNQQRPKRIKEKDIESGWWDARDYTSRLRFLNRLIKKLESENK